MSNIKKNQTILIVGGVHGDEPTGISVASYFLKKPHGSIKSVVCNEFAIKKNRRYIETDLNRSFNAKVPISLEEKLAHKLKSKIKGFDIIIDIHNTKALSTTCAIVTSNPNRMQLSIADYFGFDKVVIMTPCGSLIEQNSERSISLEIAKNDIPGYSNRFLIDKISRLNLTNISCQNEIKIFKQVGAVTRATVLNNAITSADVQNFVLFTRDQKKKLNLDMNVQYYPIFAKKDFPDDLGFILVEEVISK